MRKSSCGIIGFNIEEVKMRKVVADSRTADGYKIASAHKTWQYQPSTAETMIWRL